MELPLADLPAGVPDWVTETGAGRIVDLRRHVCRREGWVVDVERADGSTLEGFLRVERGPVGDRPSNLQRETRIVQALAGSGVPVVPVHGTSSELRATLFGRDPGRSDIDEVDDPSQQRAVMEDFMRVLARLHAIDVDTLGLDDVLDPRPTSPEECGLAEVERARATWAFFLDGYVDPLITFGLDWLRRHVPREARRIALLQGDTGPVNFMFQGDRVSSVIDWELGHFGDPMEDLGSVCVREYWNPAGGLDGLFSIYEQESGLPVDLHAVRFHRVRQNVRDMMAIHYINANPIPQESMAWYLCYRYCSDRATIEAIADDTGVAVAPPPLPDDSAETDDVVAARAVASIRDDVMASVGDDMARSRLVDIDRLVRCMDRRRRFGADLADDERGDLAQLLGVSAATAEAGRAALDEQLKSGRYDEAAVITYLARKAYRDEWLYAPAIEKYPDRHWSAIS